MRNVIQHFIMSRILLLMSVLTIIISCKNEKYKLIEAKPTSEKKIQISNWGLFEKEVFKTIDNLEKSDSKNRKFFIEKFLSYQNKVDGAVAEAYSNFAFEYVEDNTEDFFSVLESNDSLLIKKWSEVSSSEIVLISENKMEMDSIWTRIHENHFTKRAKLKPLKRELDLYYLIKLKEDVKKH